MYKVKLSSNGVKIAESICTERELYFNKVDDRLKELYKHLPNTAISIVEF